MYLEEEEILLTELVTIQEKKYSRNQIMIQVLNKVLDKD